MKRKLSVKSLTISIVTLFSIAFMIYAATDPYTALAALSLPEYGGLVISAGFPFSAVLWPDGEQNMGGTTNRAYFVPLSAIEAFPMLAVAPANAEDEHTLEGSLTLKVGTNVVELYTTYKTGTLMAEVEGEIDGKFFKLTPEFFHPGSRAEIINFASKCINTPGVLFIPEKAESLDPMVDSEYLVVGSPGHPVYLSPSFDLGKVGEGRKGTTFTGEAYSQLMLTKYTGDLPLDEVTGT